MSANQIIGIPRDKVAPLEECPNFARDQLNADHVAGLMASIERDGLLQPPRMYFDQLKAKYVTCFGFHRVAAQLQMQLEVITAIVTATPPTKAQLREWQFVENQSLQMKPMERARAVIGIRDEHEESNTATAERLGIKSVSLLTDWENWLLLPPAYQEAIDSGALPESSASWLARCEDAATRDELFGQVMLGKLSRDQVKAAVQKSKGGARKYAKSAAPGRLTLKHKSGVTIRIDGGDLPAIRTALGWAGRRANAVEDIQQLEEGE